MYMAEHARERCDTFSGRRSSRSSGVPPGFSSTSVLRPLSRVSATGRRLVGVGFVLERTFVFKRLDTTG
jgi:hypothetical protein